MANWCSNSVTLFGDENKIKQVMDEVKLLEKKGNENHCGVTAIDENVEDRFMFEICTFNEDGFDFESKWSPAFNSLRFFAMKYGITITNRYHEPGNLVYGEWQCDGDGNETDVWLERDEYRKVEYIDEKGVYSFNGEESDYDGDFLEEILDKKLHDAWQQ